MKQTTQINKATAESLPASKKKLLDSKLKAFISSELNQELFRIKSNNKNYFTALFY